MIYNTLLESTTTDEVNYLAGIKLAKFDESMSLAECFATIMAESTLEWNTIAQEASIDALIDTSRVILGEAEGEDGDTASKKSFKEKVIAFLNQAIEWLKGLASKLFGVISNVLSKIESMTVSNKKLFANHKALWEAFQAMTEDQKKVTVFFDPSLKGTNITAIKGLATKETEAFKSKFLVNNEGTDAETLKAKLARYKQDSEYVADKYCDIIIKGSTFKTIKDDLAKKYDTTSKEIVISKDDFDNAYKYGTDKSVLRQDTKVLYNGVKESINGLIAEINKAKKQLSKKNDVDNVAREACSVYVTNMKKVANVVTLTLNTYLSVLTANMKGARTIVFAVYKVANKMEKDTKKAEKKADKEQAANASFMFDFESSFNPELI